MSKSYKKGLREALKDETSAPKMYEGIAKKAHGKADKRALRHIAKQERKHRKTVQKILNKTGRKK